MMKFNALERLLRLSNKGRMKLKSGDIIEVKPLTLKQSIIVERLFAPISDDIARLGVDAFVDIQAKHADELIAIVATSINKSVNFVESMDRDDFNEIWRRLLEVEAPFFQALVKAARAKQKE